LNSSYQTKLEQLKEEFSKRLKTDYCMRTSSVGFDGIDFDEFSPRKFSECFNFREIIKF